MTSPRDRIAHEIAIFERAAAQFDPEAYDLLRPAAREAWSNDARWFAANPDKETRIRRVKPEESCLAWWAASEQGVEHRAVVYAIVLHHERLHDTREAIGVSITMVLTDTSPGLHEHLRGEARKLLEWFKYFPTQPEEDEGVWPQWGIACRNTTGEAQP